jgi:hypothetical protein
MMTMLFEIINPSDAYGIEGEELTCAVAVLLLGEGQYGLEIMDEGERKGETTLPLLLFGGVEEWLAEVGIENLGTYYAEHALELAEALDTVEINPVAYQIALRCLPDGADLNAFRAIWHDKHRGSLNDIGARAGQLATRLRKIKEKEQAK